MGLLSRKSTPSTPRSSTLARPTKQREPREREQHKPYASVRRVMKPFRSQAAPKQNMLRDRNADLRAAYGKTTMVLRRWFREGELAWCALSIPIRGQVEGESIQFWPGLVEEIILKSEPIPRDPIQGDAEGSDTTLPMGQPTWRVSPHPSSGRVSAVGETPTPWTVRQSTVYKIKLLGVSHTYTLPDNQVLPYQAYAPQTELLNAIKAIPLEQMDTRPESIATFNPCPAPPSQSTTSEGSFVSNDNSLRWAAAAAAYSIAIEIAAGLAGTWTVTNEWDFKYVITPLTGNSATAPLSGPAPSLLQIMQSAAANNAGLHSGTTATISQSMQPTVTQKRFQGMWWGAERIWVDDFIRLKVARSQIAPYGSENIYPPAGPSQKTIEYNREQGFPDPAGPQFDASGRGVFMKLDALSVKEIPKANGVGVTASIEASGMLYELADEDWEDPHEIQTNEAPEQNAAHPVQNGPVGTSPTPGSSPLERPTLPNPDPTVENSAQSNANTQLSHPVNAERYPLPAAPDGYKFRPILPPGNESAISLTLISGRYYPGLLSHPLLQSAVESALINTTTADNKGASDHIWALEGIAPGFYNSVDPTYFKKDRLVMIHDADSEARRGMEEHWRKLATERLEMAVIKQEMEVDPNLQDMDVAP